MLQCNFPSLDGRYLYILLTTDMLLKILIILFLFSLLCTQYNLFLILQFTSTEIDEKLRSDFTIVWRVIHFNSKLKWGGLRSILRHFRYRSGMNLKDFINSNVKHPKYFPYDFLIFLFITRLSGDPSNPTSSWIFHAMWENFQLVRVLRDFSPTFLA